MNPVDLQTSVAEKIKALYAISRELEQLFPGRHYTPDGHMVGSIGEALAASCYGLEMYRSQLSQWKKYGLFHSVMCPFQLFPDYWLLL